VCLEGTGEADSTSGCTAESILNQLKTKQLGRTLIVLDECASTNDAARKLASNAAAHGSLIISATQTDGRGRHGKRWISPRGGIWMTLILRSPTTRQVEWVPLIGALSVARAVHSQLGIDSRVRWPNDVVVNGSKVAGLIAEGHQQGDSLEFVLLGIGVNANFESRQLLDRKVDAVTLMDLNGGTVDNSSLVCNILLELEELLSLAASDPQRLLEFLRRRDYSAGRNVKVVMEDRMVEGVFVEYQSLGAVLVDSKGERVIVPASSALLVEYSE
jgi:BirA family biotin operon repressor/biotin-[acetyl-CoA-carboxylase] ligase